MSPSSAGTLRVLVVLLVGWTTGCVTPYVPLPPLGTDRSVANLDPDEAALWKESRAIQYKIDVSGLLFEDRALDAYLQRVLDRVTPPELTKAALSPKVQIISNPDIHGYSFANGVIYIHTALLSRMENEPQLAALLSRELAHVVNRHALRAHRDEKLRADALAWVGVGTSLVEGGGNYKLLFQAASLTSAVGFSHHLETSADRKGLEIMAAADYDVRKTLDLYEASIAHLAEVHSQGPWAWAAFTPPAPVTARIAGYRAIIETEYIDPSVSRAPFEDAEGFRRRVHGATLRECDLELAAGLFVSAETCARLATASGPRDPQAWLLLGKALGGQRTKPIAGRGIPSIRKVRDALRQALSVDARNAEATRELGMSFYRTTGTSRSKEAASQALRHFRRYLRLAPKASDGDYVRGYVRELEAETR